jgi:CheY-like chemotaxis protein
LPRINQTAGAEEVSKEVKSLRGTETILLVEDEDQVRRVALGLLTRHGYRVLEARNAGEGLLVCERYGEQIDLLLSDVVMPQMSGPEVAKRIALARPGIKILCMSGYTDETILRHGILEAGIAFLQKPLTPESLLSKVREVLDAPPAIPPY